MESVFCSKHRIQIMNIVSNGEQARFNFLKKVTDLSDGNLASHLRALEQQGMITYQKKFIGRMPATFYRITEKGRKEYAIFKRDMMELIT